MCRYLALGKYAFGGYGFIDPIIGPLAFAPFKERVFTGFVHLFCLFEKTIYPVDLSPDYSFNQIPLVSNIFSSPQAIIGFAFFSVLILAIFGPKRFKIATILFPNSLCVYFQYIFITTGTMAERWWYFPSFGLVILLAIGLDKIITKIKNGESGFMEDWRLR